MKIEKKFPDITTLLRTLRDGDPGQQKETRDSLFRLIEFRLHELAEKHLRRGGRRDPLLQPSLLVIDVFQKVLGNITLGPKDRIELFAFARLALPQILVGYARKFRAREGKAPHIPFDGSMDVPGSEPPLDSIDLIALQECLERLGEFDPVQHQIVIDHFYLGRSFPNIAAEMGISLKKVEKKWKVAKLWLHRQLSDRS